MHTADVQLPQIYNSTTSSSAQGFLRAQENRISVVVLGFSALFSPLLLSFFLLSLGIFKAVWDEAWTELGSQEISKRTAS